MTEGIKINRWLLPLAWLYGAGTALRNKFFDWGWLRSKEFDVPVICIGNLAVGGTGKTPHTEYLIQLLQAAGLQVATLSRGYKRKSRGYILADEQSSAERIGDEPYQMKSKFPAVRVAVDADRCHGIEQLLKVKNPTIDVILLDDAFQHRYVKAGLNILLTDYHRLICEDRLLPAGRLRESVGGKERAQIVIVTKCPDDIKPIDFNIIGKQLKLYPYQHLYFSRFRYGSLLPMDEATSNKRLPLSACKGKHVLLVTGIASPTPLLKELEKQAQEVKLLAFGDHHDFSNRELQHIEEEYLKLPEEKRMLITTEKDAARLRDHPALGEVVKRAAYVLPIEIEFLQNQQNTFNQNIIGYVRTNSRNSCLSERKDAHTT
ncbi:MAG: tetraacyldisaccharide 4'-kinase [Bacteroides sp.]|nr:tetraacyldisaccharide 4'-kinase [Bacteroides sp.]